MEDLSDLIFDPSTGDFSVDPSMSFEEMEDVISDDNDDSKEIISFGYMEPTPKFGDLEACIMQDEESTKEHEKDCSINSDKNDS